MLSVSRSYECSCTSNGPCINVTSHLPVEKSLVTIPLFERIGVGPRPAAVSPNLATPV